MSKLRNTSSAPRRGRNTALAASALTLGSLTAGLLTACSSDAHDPTAPAPAAPANYYGTTTVPTAPSNTWDSQRQLSGSTFDGLLGTWRTQSSDVQPGTRLPATMQCTSTQSAASTSRSFSPSAYQQSMTVGRATVTFPGGSIPSNVTITAASSLSSNGVQIDFQPHGYKFAKPIQVSINYAGCSYRYSSPLNFYFLNDSGGIIQTMPSSDDRMQTTIRAMTDHFSRYMVAWS